MTEGFALYELIDDDHGRAIDWRVLEVNDAYTRHTGIAREGSSAGSSAKSFLSLSRSTCRSSPVSWLASPSTSRRMPRPSSATSISSPSRRRRRFANIIEDITARRKAEEALRPARSDTGPCSTT